MSTRRPLIGLIVAAGLFVAACTGSATPTPGASSSGAGGGVTVSTTTTALGTFLVGPDQKTLYVHAGDSMNTSTCTGACLANWPPLAVAAGQQATLAPGIAGTLATFTGPDGKTWVTYNGLPLYGWKGDKNPGDTTGQGVNGFSVAKVTGAAASGGAGGATSAPAGGGGAATPPPSGITY